MQGYVLIIAEDHPDRAAWAQALAKAGFQAQCSSSPHNLNTHGGSPVPAVVILEWSLLPRPATAEVVEQCRSLRAALLAILDTTNATTYDFARGGDDFLMSPVDPQELTLRVRQLLWRIHGTESQQAIRRGDLVIDPDRYEVTLGGRQVFLTFKEYQLLRLLASNPGRVYTRETLLSQVWGYDYFGGTRTVDVHVRRLRAKIETAGQTFIETVRNVGYRFRPSDS